MPKRLSRRVATLMATLTLATVAITSLAVGAAPAAATVGAAVANCNGHVLLSANYVRSDDRFRFGSIQLCRDGDHYFAMYINYWYDPGEPAQPPQGPMPDGQFANAWLYRYLDGGYVDRFSCDDSGGNGHVLPGQTWCVTPKIYAPSSRVTFRGAGFVYFWDGTQWEHVASGWTQRCNRHVGCVPA